MSWQSQQRYINHKKKTNNKRNFVPKSEKYYPKNRAFCAECGRPKILFESEDKANRYIEYNAQYVINRRGNQPTRAYYCESCGGWHVTHHSEPLNVSKTPTQRLIEAYHNDLNFTVRWWNNVEDAGIFLDDESKSTLMNVLSQQEGLPEAKEYYCDHATLYHHSQFRVDSQRASKVMSRIDKEIEKTDHNRVRFTVDAIGVSDQAVAFRVLTHFPHLNNVLHITAYTCNGGKPVDSNKITDWRPLASKIKLSGEIRKIERDTKFLSYQDTTPNN